MTDAQGVCAFLYAMRCKVLFHRGLYSSHHLLPTSGMSNQSGLLRLQVLLKAALKDYEQTGIALAKHPLAGVAA